MSIAFCHGEGLILGLLFINMLLFITYVPALIIKAGTCADPKNSLRGGPSPDQGGGRTNFTIAKTHFLEYRGERGPDIPSPPPCIWHVVQGRGWGS